MLSGKQSWWNSPQYIRCWLGKCSARQGQRAPRDWRWLRGTRVSTCRRWAANRWTRPRSGSTKTCADSGAQKPTPGRIGLDFYKQEQIENLTVRTSWRVLTLVLRPAGHSRGWFWIWTECRSPPLCTWSPTPCSCFQRKTKWCLCCTSCRGILQSIWIKNLFQPIGVSNTFVIVQDLESARENN